MTKRIRCQIRRVRYNFPSLKAAAQHFLIPMVPLRGRLRAGWKIGKALSTPIAYRKPRAYVPHPDVLAHAARVAKANANQTRH